MSIPNQDALTLLVRVINSHECTVTARANRIQCDCGLTTRTIQHWRNHILTEITKTGWTPPIPDTHNPATNN